MVGLNSDTGLPEPNSTIISRDELRDWLSANHAQAAGVWLITYKKSAGANLFVDRWDVLDELLCFGWIDGRRLKVSADTKGERTAQFISPRRQQNWTQAYRERFARLETEGLMAAPGRAAAKAAKEQGTWVSGEAVDALHVPPALRHALNDANASGWFDQAAPSYRRNVLRWLATAKQQATQEKRIGIIVAHAAKGEKVPNY